MPVDERTCGYCGASIAGRHRRSKFCSPKCKSRHQNSLPVSPDQRQKQRDANKRCYQKHREQRLAKRRTADKAIKAAKAASYYRQNRDRILAVDRRRKLAIREKRIAYMKAYNAKPEVKARSAAWRRANAERVRATNQQARKRRPEAHREYSANNHYKRKTAILKTQHEPIDRIAVFTRDKWRCQLCGVATPKSMLGKKPVRANCPTIDHIVPLSRGGAHLFRNVQCACFQCNCRKQTHVRGQLRLL